MSGIVGTPLYVSFNGKTLVFGVDLSNTVESLKEAIKVSHGFPVATQRLIFKGKMLENDMTLDDCGIDEHDTLHLVVRGGGRSRKSRSRKSRS